MDGGRRESVGDDDRGIVSAWREERSIRVAETAAQVGTTEIGGAIGRCAVQQDVGHAERCGIERLVYGIAGARVVELEAQQLAGRQAMARAAQRDSRGRVRSQVNSHGSGFNCGGRSSHASNSGAGLRPRTERRYSASWKLVLW